jgi:hypothetical protein
MAFASTPFAVHVDRCQWILLHTSSVQVIIVIVLPGSAGFSQCRIRLEFLTNEISFCTQFGNFIT